MCNLHGDWKITLRLQNFKFCCMDFTNCHLNCKDFLPIKGKTQTNSFFYATKNTFFSKKILSKNVLTHLLNKVRWVTISFKYIF